MDATVLSASELAGAIRRRQLSATEAVQSYVERIERLNPSLNAVIHLDTQRGLFAAARADRGPSNGPLHGVPMLLKDSHRVAGMPTIVGNPDAPTAPAARDGFVAARLRAAGAILLGKTNVARDLADFQTDNPVHGRTNNPWDITRTPGGSSGGAAAAIAARLTPVEVGSDIAGSVRLPAHFTGVIGLKPTAGSIRPRGHVTEPVLHPRGGGVGALATLGPLARTFDDLDLLVNLLAPSAFDAFEPARVRIGVLPAFPGVRVDPAISQAVSAMGRAAGSCVQLVEPPVDPAEQHETCVAVYEAARAHGSAWGRVSAVAREQARVRRAWDDLLSTVDAVILPPAMCTAFTHRPTGSPIDVDGVPVPYWGLARYTEPFNLTGHPAIVIRAGRDAAGLTIGVQVMAGWNRDRWLVRMGEWLERLHGDSHPAPPTSAERDADAHM